MDLDRKRFMLFLPLLFTVILFGCDGSNGSDSSSPTQAPSAYTENDFVADASLRIPISQTAVTFLEPPNTVQEVDTHEPGTDTVPYYFQEPGEYTFCWESDIENAQHYMHLVDEAGNEVLRVLSNEACATATIKPGNYTMFLVHDGLTINTIPVFIAANSGATDQTLQPQYDVNQVQTLIYSNSCEHCDLTGANLTRADLNSANLTGANLTGANLWLTYLTQAILTDAILTGADLTGAHLVEANLTGAYLYEAILTDANLGDAILTGADLTEANLNRAFLIEAHLIGAHLTAADLTAADLTGADLTEAILTWADLTDAILTQAILTGADLTEANLTGATWVDGEHICEAGSIGECKY